MESFHSEQLLRMPAPFCQWCYPGTLDLAVNELPLSHKGWVTFGSFNSQLKMTPKTLELWQRLLRALPSARIRFVGIDSAIARSVIVESFARQGQADRIELAPRLPYAEFLAACHSVDIALDPLLFSGATTTCDVLWMGLPVITWPSDSSVSRSTASILAVLDMREFVVHSADAYIEVAVHWANSIERLSNLRHGLRQRVRNSSLMDAPGFVREFEYLLRQCWHRWCAGRPDSRNTLNG
jgi:protein O-GlcNAc transferase